MLRFLLLPSLLALALLPANVVPSALPLLQDEWGASGTAAGWLFGAYQVGYVLGVLLLLPLTDRYSVRVVILASAALTALASIGFALFAVDVASGSLWRLVAGFGLAGIYMPGVRIAARAARPERRGLTVGLYVGAFYAGSALSFLLTGLLLPSVGWRGAALVLGVLSAGALPLVLLATRGLPSVPSGRARFDPAVLRNGRVVRTTLAYTGHSWELYVSRGWLAAFLAGALVARGVDPVGASATGSQWAALMNAFGVPGVFLGGWLSDRLGRPRAALLLVGCSAVGSFTFGLLFGAQWAVLVAVGCLYGLVVAADSPIYSTAITEVAEPHQVGSAQALQSFVGFGATVVSPVAAGMLLDAGLGWWSAFALAGTVGVLLALPLVRDAR